MPERSSRLARKLVEVCKEKKPEAGSISNISECVASVASVASKNIPLEDEPAKVELTYRNISN